MFEKEAEEYANEYGQDAFTQFNMPEWIEPIRRERKLGFQRGAEFSYNKTNVRHSPDEHIDKDRVVLGIIKLCNKTRYSLVQWNGEWWYQYGSFNAEVRLIAWYNIPELPCK